MPVKVVALAGSAAHPLRTPDWRDLPLSATVAADLAHGRVRRGSRSPRSVSPTAARELALFDTVAHEIRGPITALALSAELLADDFDHLDPLVARSLLAAIHRRALYLQELVDNLLCSATIREGRLKLHRAPVTLTDVVADARSLVAPLLAQKHQPLRVRSSDAVPPVLADSRRLGQVLINLLLNASNFGLPGRPIDLTVSRRARWVRVAVADHGPGLPSPAAALRLLEPYFRAQSPATTANEGLGLGLSIVQAIIHAHSGRVGATNRSAGGARFWFELPLD